MGSGVEFLDEFLQLGGIDVANCPEFEALCVPTSNVESLHFVDLRALMFRRRFLRDEEIDHMHPTPVDDGSDRLAVEIVEPPTDQPEALGCQVDDGRCDVNFAVEPRFLCAGRSSARR